MATVYQPQRVVWPPQPYYPNQYQSGFPAMGEASARYSRHLEDSRISRRESERRESLRRSEQVRADAVMAARLQEEDERLLYYSSRKTAQMDRTASPSIRSSTSRSLLGRRTPSIVVEPFIPPQHDQAPTRSTPAPTSPPRVSTPRVSTPSLATQTKAVAAPPVQQTPSVKNAAEELREHTKLFTRSPLCSRCGTKMNVEPLVDISLGKQLHLTCDRCSTTHCRGCVQPVDCGARCDAIRDQCRLKKCCSRGRAVAIFEILGLFDKEYTASAENVCGSDIWPVPEFDRNVFLEFVTSNAEERFSKRFNKSFTATLQALHSWLPLEEHIHRSVRLLLSTSFLLEVVRAYLENSTRSHIHWVIHGELYVEIMSLLTLLGREESHRDLVMGRLPKIHSSSGVQAWMWDAASEWKADMESTRESLYTVAGEGSIRTDLRKMEKRNDARTQNLVSQLLMDLNHVVCMSVLN
ncbi:hypothetical protein FPV67DRAFT_110411 [Lyophyllum atratum]|nr:hypothetical protein FPV67DRAFT_110411 [Lyophyllum atratum]